MPPGCDAHEGITLMAIFDPGILAGISGKMGGVVFSHNAGGPYIRNKGLVTNPNTPKQQTVRALLAQLTSLWVDTLTAVQRDGWTNYAANVPLINRLGQARNVSALNQYVRSNVPLIQAGFARQDDAPVIFSLGDFTQPIALAQAAGQTLTVVFTDTDDWAGEDDAGMLVYVSRPQNQSVKFFAGPYQLAGSIDGDALLPPVSPALLPLPFIVAEGQNVFWRAQVIRADGRLSADVKLSALVGP